MLDKLKKLWKSLGPGLITGASDDDPSGIVIYSIAGAKFGLATLWTALITLPFMIVIQRMAGRIGLISGKGLAGNMKKYYPAWILISITLMISAATIINIGADISAMSAAFNLLIPLPPILLSAIISGLVIILLISLPYRIIAHYLKWVAIVMFSYVLAAFFIHQDWSNIFYRLFVPKIIWSKEYLAVMVALFGTTISPYLFFWQASEEVEEIRNMENPAIILDVKSHKKPESKLRIKNEIGSMYEGVNFGMVFSNLITFFVIILTASTFFKNGVTNIATVEDIAGTLRPLAGPYANILFLIGIMASGILAIPVLAGSAAYALAEMFGWKSGFDHNFHKAKQFYLVIIISIILGLLIPVLHIHPVDILFYTGLIFGMVSPFLILLVIHMANNPKVMGQYTSQMHSNIIAYILFIIMSVSIVATFLL